MHSVIRHVLLVSFLLGGAAETRAQVDDAEMERQLELVGQMLGLPPVGPDELKREVATLGALDFEKDVPINFMSRDELASYIRELFDDEYSVDFAAREERMLRGFGFLKAGEKLRPLREKVLNENVAGFYDERPGVKKLFAISSGQSLNVMNQMVLSHELRHAIQDQHVVIREKLQVESDFDDRRLAALCLFEGDASLMMQEYLASRAKNRPEVAGMFAALSQNLSGAEVAQQFAGPALQSAPPVVQEQLIVPYFQGPKLAQRIYDRGGFTLLSQSLESPPRSMEQVLHPEKYLETVDEPVAVSLPDAGAEPDFEGRLGELFIRVLLEAGSATAATAETAAAGWGGDAYAVLANGNGSYRLVWRTAWDTERDAQEFERAFRSFVADRFEGEATSLTRDGKTVSYERKSFQ